MDVWAQMRSRTSRSLLSSSGSGSGSVAPGVTVPYSGWAASSYKRPSLSDAFTKSARGSKHRDQNVLTSRAACRSRPRQLAQIPMVVERRCHRGMNAELMLSHPRPPIRPYIHALCQFMHSMPSLHPLPTITPTTTCLSSTTPFHTHHIPHPLPETRYESRETLDTRESLFLEISESSSASKIF